MIDDEEENKQNLNNGMIIE